MPLHLNVSGTWKAPVVWINNAGTWKKAAVWLNVSGVWKQITTLLGATLPSTISPNQSYPSTAYLYVDAAGTWSASNFSSGTWMNGGSGSDYEVRLTQVSGSAIGGSSLATWMALSTNRSWNLTSAASDKYATATLEIRLAASPYTVLATSTVYFSAYGYL